MREVAVQARLTGVFVGDAGWVGSNTGGQYNRGPLWYKCHLSKASCRKKKKCGKKKKRGVF
jgi:hypothetical protein